MKTLEEINAQIEEQANVIKKLRAEKDKIIEELSKKYVGEYIKLINTEDSFCIMKLTKVSLDETDTPYKFYGDVFKFTEGDHRFVEDHVLFSDDFDKIESLSEEEYNEYKNQFIEKLKEL